MDMNFLSPIAFFESHRFPYDSAYSVQTNEYSNSMLALSYSNQCEAKYSIGDRYLNMMFCLRLNFLYCQDFQTIILTAEEQRSFLVYCKTFYIIVGEKKNIESETEIKI